VPVLLVLLLLGPAETLAGKFPGHAPEYLDLHPAEPVPLPDPLPGDVDGLCRLVEAGHALPEVYAALGDALLARGDDGLAYRAFHRAQALRPGDPAWTARMQERKDRSAYVSNEVIEEEERQARYWVERLQEYERARIREGADPRDLGPFHERYGRPEDDLEAIARQLRARWALVAGAVLLGVAVVLGGALLFLRRRA
jgi:hypothetical protein